MRTLVLTTVVGLGLLVGSCAVVPGLWSHVKQVPKDIGQGIDEVASDNHAGGTVDEGFNEAEKGLRKKFTKIYQAKAKMAGIEAELKAQKESLSKENQILSRAQELLEKNQPGSTIVVGNAEHKWEDINQDALSRLHNCQMLSKKMKVNEQSLGQLRQGVEAGFKAIVDVQEKLRQEKMQFDLEKVELAALRAQEEVREIVGDISETASAGNSELANVRKAYNDRLNEARANAEFSQMTEIRKNSNVSWDKELGFSPQKASEGIKAYFNEAKKPAVAN